MIQLRKPCVFKVAKDTGAVEAIIASMNIVDKDGDVTLPGFFGKQPVKMLPTHDWSSVTLGKGAIREDVDKAVADLNMNLDIEKARDWHSALKFDLANPPAIQEWSYGFRLKEGGYSRGELEGKSVRFLKPLEDGSPGCIVDEVSPVVVGAGEGTGTRSVKGAGDGKTFCDEADAALAAVRGLIKRAKSLAELRAKDGRRLSAENQEKLAGLLADMEKAAPEIKAFLGDETEELRSELSSLYLSRLKSGR